MKHCYYNLQLIEEENPKVPGIIVEGYASSAAKKVLFKPMHLPCSIRVKTEGSEGDIKLSENECITDGINDISVVKDGSFYSFANDGVYEFDYEPAEVKFAALSESASQLPSANTLKVSYSSTVPAAGTPSNVLTIILD